MDIETIRVRIQEGNYLIKSHAIQHAIKEGFERRHMVEAVMNGKIIGNCLGRVSSDKRISFKYSTQFLENTSPLLASC